jgi:hypothetical protein
VALDDIEGSGVSLLTGLLIRCSDQVDADADIHGAVAFSDKILALFKLLLSVDVMGMLPTSVILQGVEACITVGNLALKAVGSVATTLAVDCSEQQQRVLHHCAWILWEFLDMLGKEIPLADATAGACIAYAMNVYTYKLEQALPIQLHTAYVHKLPYLCTGILWAVARSANVSRCAHEDVLSLLASALEADLSIEAHRDAVENALQALHHIIFELYSTNASSISLLFKLDIPGATTRMLARWLTHHDRAPAGGEQL